MVQVPVVILAVKTKLLLVIAALNVSPIVDPPKSSVDVSE
jgi:hypothetical protein